MRGLYTAGVLDLFLDEGIHFNTVYGVSAGACHACSYLSGQFGRARKTVMDFLDDKYYASFYSLAATGNFFNVSMVYDDIPNHLLPYDYDAFIAAAASFYSVVTNIETGCAEYPLISDLRKDMPWIQASSALPLFAQAVEVSGQSYLDGGIVDAIPLAQAASNGCKKHVIILTQPPGYVKKREPLMPLLRLMYSEYPYLLEALETRHVRYNHTLANIVAAKSREEALIIQPKTPLDVGRLEKNPKKLDALYIQGYIDGRSMLPQLQRFL